METKTLLMAIQIVLSVALTVAILLQVRGSGLGNIFGGGGGEFYRSKRGIEKLLFNATILLSGLFVANSIALAYVYS